MSELETNKKLVAITHNDRFHADDVFAAATLSLVFGDDICFKRTRNEFEIQEADIVFDVGHVNNSDINRFDHHQPEGAGKRENGVPYASFGLVWKKFGIDLCGSGEASDFVDSDLVQVIDAGDNGFSFYDYRKDINVKEFNLASMVSFFGMTWKEENHYDSAFLEVLEIAKIILKRVIKHSKDFVEAKPLVEQAYSSSLDKRFVILDQYYPFKKILRDKEELLFVVSPSKNADAWRVEGMSTAPFLYKKYLPESWSGLKGEELEKETGVKDSVFCHRARFMCSARTREAAIQLLELALKN